MWKWIYRVALTALAVVALYSVSPAFAAKSGYVETPDGAPLYYEIHGSGKTVVLIHGWTANGTIWDKNVPQLAKTHQVLVMDLRGHGRSGKTNSGYNIEQFAKDVRTLLEKLNLSEVTLVGWSLGGSVVWSYVDQFGTDRLRSVVIVDMSPMLFSVPGWDHAFLGGFSPQYVGGFVEALRTNYSGTIKGDVTNMMFSETPSAAVIAQLHAERMKMPPEAAILSVQDLVYRDFRSVLKKVTVPTLLMFGRSNNKLFPTEVGAWLEANMPQARLVRFAKSAHTPHWEESEKFNTELTAFVR